MVAGDVLQSDSLSEALKGVHTAYYLVHSMGAANDFEDEDRTAARNFAEAARQNGVAVLSTWAALAKRIGSCPSIFEAATRLARFFANPWRK